MNPEIFLRFSTNDDTQEIWYSIIGSNDITPKEEMTRENDVPSISTCIGFNGAIYATGGAFERANSTFTGRSPPLSNCIYKFDIRGRQGWKLDGSMLESRKSHGMIVFKGKIHIVGGIPEWSQEALASTVSATTLHIYSEYFVPGEIRRALGFISHGSLNPLTDVNLIDRGNEIFLYSRHSMGLYRYSPILGKIALFDGNFGLDIVSCVIFDGFLYYLKAFEVGKIFTYSLADRVPGEVDVKVWGLDEGSRNLPYRAIDSTVPTQFLIRLNQNTLAVVWATKIREGFMEVHCSRFRKSVNNSNHEMPTFKFRNRKSRTINADEFLSCVTV